MIPITGIDMRLVPAIVEHVKAGKHMADYRGVAAYCNVYFADCFVIKDVSIVCEFDGIKVSMPDRKLTIRFSCGHKNCFDSNYCSNCGAKRNVIDVPNTGARRYIDACHPTVSEFRRYLNKEVITELNRKISNDPRTNN